jgi:hypothetical protein
VKTGLPNRLSGPQQDLGGTSHPTDDRLNRLSAVLHDSGGSPWRSCSSFGAIGRLTSVE